MRQLPTISRQDELEFSGIRQIMGMSGPWVGDMYLGARGIAKQVIKGNLVHNKNQKKLFYVQQHEGYFTINYYDIEQGKSYKLDMQLEMAFIDNVHGKKMVYYEALNNQDGKYRKSIRLDEIKHLPLADDEKPEDKPIKYTVAVPLDKPLVPHFTPGDLKFIIILLACIAFGITALASHFQALPFIVVAAMVLYGFTKAMVSRHNYITRLTVMDDELHVEYAENRAIKKKVYKLYDIKVDLTRYPKENDEWRLAIYNWKKTVMHFEQGAQGNWTEYLIRRTADELGEFTPRTGRTS